MTVRVWSPTAGTPIRLKVEDADDDTHTVETRGLTTVASENGNPTLILAMKAHGTAEINYALHNKASIFFDFGTIGLTGGTTYYWDDMEFGPYRR
ncbi:MAG: hypothetical protein R2764_01945 [Bacteroidales bacterium]